MLLTRSIFGALGMTNGAFIAVSQVHFDTEFITRHVDISLIQAGLGDGRCYIRLLCWTTAVREGKVSTMRGPGINPLSLGDSGDRRRLEEITKNNTEDIYVLLDKFSLGRQQNTNGNCRLGYGRMLLG